MKDAVGTVFFLSGVLLVAVYTNRLIRPWPQKYVVFGFLILFLGVVLVAGLVGWVFG